MALFIPVMPGNSLIGFLELFVLSVFRKFTLQISQIRDSSAESQGVVEHLQEDIDDCILIGLAIRFTLGINIENDDTGKFLIVMIKNISAQELNITGEELMERFTRGDRSRNTEGSGLGLSIAKSLMELQGGNIKITVDGDLFKVELLIPRA